MDDHEREDRLSWPWMDCDGIIVKEEKRNSPTATDELYMKTEPIEDTQRCQTLDETTSLNTQEVLVSLGPTISDLSLTVLDRHLLE